MRHPIVVLAAAFACLAPMAVAGTSGPDSLTIFFGEGSATLSPDAISTLDTASRIYRQGNPIVMQVSGGTDSVGSPATNLRLSEARARTVLRGLVARGIPVEHFQLLAKGATEPMVQGTPGMPEPRNRRVDITWR